MADITVTITSAIAGTAAQVEPVARGCALRLGVSGAQHILPDLIWPEGSAPEVPYEQESTAEESRQLDGSNRVNLPSYAPGAWTLQWDGILWAEVQRIIAAASLTSELVYTNQFTDNADHTVFVQSRAYSLKAETAGATKRYTFTLTLRELPA